MKIAFSLAVFATTVFCTPLAPAGSLPESAGALTQIDAQALPSVGVPDQLALGQTEEGIFGTLVDEFKYQTGITPSGAKQADMYWAAHHLGEYLADKSHKAKQFPDFSRLCRAASSLKGGDTAARDELKSSLEELTDEGVFVQALAIIENAEGTF